MTEQIQDNEAVLSALERAKSWPDLARSPQLSRFLDYIVHRVLEGQSSSIKAYSIAVDVFGRPADFDPQADPIVRVQARRLRSLLEQYYSGPGKTDEVQIVLPVGRYIPDFISRAAAETVPARPVAVVFDANHAPAPSAKPKPKRRGRVTVSWLVLLVIALGAGALAYSLSTWGPRQEQQVLRQGLVQPSLRILDFQNLTDDPTITAQVQGLGVNLIDRLQQVGFINVSYAANIVGSSDAAANSFALSGLVRRAPNAPGDLQYSVILTDRSTNNIVWNRSVVIPGTGAAAKVGIDRFAIDVLSVLGNPRGPMHDEARQFLSQTTIEGIESPYVCRLLFTIYRENMSIGASERARSCFTALPGDSESSGLSLAAMASLIGEGAERDGTPSAEMMERYREANELITAALEAAPTSSFVWEQRARLFEALDSPSQAEAAYTTSLQINPSNIDALAAFARHLAFKGRLDQAAPMSRRAISAYSVVPDWYHGVPTLISLRDGDYAAAKRHAAIYARADWQIGPVLALLAADGAGDAEEIARQLPRILEVTGFRRMGIITQLRRRISDSALLQSIREALLAAGVPEAALVSPF